MEKAEGRGSVSQATMENGIENSGLELMVIHIVGCGVSLAAFLVCCLSDKAARLTSPLPVLIGKRKS